MTKQSECDLQRERHKGFESTPERAKVIPHLWHELPAHETFTYRLMASGDRVFFEGLSRMAEEAKVTQFPG